VVATFKYRQPSRINAVSISFFLLLGLIAYLGYSAWPAILLHSNIKTELHDGLIQLYKANLIPEPGSSQQVTSLRGRMTANLKKLGLEKRPFGLVLKRDKKKVSIEMTYAAIVTLQWIGVQRAINLRPKVETDAARVQWD